MKMVRWMLEERRWLKPELTNLEWQWIEYQLYRQMGSKAGTLRTSDVGLTGYLRPSIINSNADADDLDRIINSALLTDERVIEVRGEYEKELWSLLYEFTLPMFTSTGRQYRWTVDHIYENYADILDCLITSTTKGQQHGQVVLGLYLTSCLEYWAFTPTPLESAAVHKALLVAEKVMVGEEMEARLCPVLTALYFKAIGSGEGVVGGRCVQVMRGFGSVVVRPMIEALEKRAQVDGLLLSPFVSSSDVKELTKIKGLEVKCPVVEAHLRESRVKDVLNKVVNNAANVYPGFRMPRQMLVGGDGQWMMLRDVTDVVYACRTRELMQGLDRAKWLRLGPARRICLPKWSNACIYLPRDRACILGRKLDGMMSDEEVGDAEHWQVCGLEGEEEVMLVGLELAYVGEMEVVLVIRHDSVEFIYGHGARLQVSLDGIVVAYTIVQQEYLVVAFNDELKWISIRTGLKTRELSVPGVYLTSCVNECIYCICKDDCSGTSEVVFVQNGSIRKKIDLEWTVTCMQAYPSGLVIGTICGRVLFLSTKEGATVVVTISELLREREDAVVALTWLWYPEERLVVHGLNDLYIFSLSPS